MDRWTRDHVARLVFESGRLLQCRRPQTAAIIRGERLTAFCWSRNIPGQEDATSPVVEALIMDRAFSRLFDTDAVLVCYRLPSCFDFMSLYESDIREVHFMGELDDPEAVTFLNKLSKASPKDGFKVVQISVDGHNIS